MKKVLLIFLLLSVNFLTFANDILIHSEQCEIKECYFPNEFSKGLSEITYEQLLKDIEYICYYLKSAYAGYDSMRQKGFEEEEFKAFLTEKHTGVENVNTRQLMKDISEYLSFYVKDGHFSISANLSNENYYITKKSLILWTNTFFEKKNNEYYLIESDFDKFNKMETFSLSEENLFYYPAKGRNVYRLGMLSDERIDSAEFEINGNKIKLPVFDDGNIDSGFGIKYHQIETDRTGYVSISSFLLPNKKSNTRKGSEIIFSKFENLSQKWKNKKNIVIDLRGNKGGEINSIETFLYNTFISEKKFEKFTKKMDLFFEDNFFEKQFIDSPVIATAKFNFINNYEVENSKYHKRDALRILKEHRKNPKINYWYRNTESKWISSPLRDKQLIFLIDRNSISAAELFPVFAKKIFGNDSIIVIGENSYGSLEYGEIYDYMLPESKLRLHLGSEHLKFLSSCSIWHGEGVGIYPDYWSTGEDLNETIFLVTKDEEMKQKLKGIETRLK